MTIVLPIAIGGRMVGSGFIVGVIRSNEFLVATTLHALGGARNTMVVVPAHGGDVSAIQNYNTVNAPARIARMVVCDPFRDAAILAVDAKGISGLRLCNMISSPDEVKVADEVVVVGYPFATIGSFTETWTPAVVSSVGHRLIAEGIGSREFTIAMQAHPGLSGSPVVRARDGVVCGMIRGCLAPSVQINIGGVVPGQDTSVTFAVTADTVRELVQDAIAKQGEREDERMDIQAGC